MPESFLNTQLWHSMLHRCLRQWTRCSLGKNIPFPSRAFYLRGVGALVVRSLGFGEPVNTLPSDTLHTFLQLTTSFGLRVTSPRIYITLLIMLVALTHLWSWMPRETLVKHKGFTTEIKPRCGFKSRIYKVSQLIKFQVIWPSVKPQSRLSQYSRITLPKSNKLFEAHMHEYLI